MTFLHGPPPVNFGLSIAFCFLSQWQALDRREDRQCAVYQHKAASYRDGRLKTKPTFIMLFNAHCTQTFYTHANRLDTVTQTITLLQQFPTGSHVLVFYKLSFTLSTCVYASLLQCFSSTSDRPHQMFIIII